LRHWNGRCLVDEPEVADGSPKFSANAFALLDAHGKVEPRVETAREGPLMEGKGFVLGLALLIAVLVLLFGVALTNGSADDGGNEDCVTQEYC
jgi:hypothetical protein